MNPSNYLTLAGLTKATERVLQARERGESRKDGMSIAMWLQNARETARADFHTDAGIVALIQKYSTSRPQDLQSPVGGHAVFGSPLPKRDYDVGDCIPGVGLVEEASGDQLKVAGQWYHRRCFKQESGHAQ